MTLQRSTRSMAWRAALDTSVGVATIVACIVLVWAVIAARVDPPAADRQPVRMESARPKPLPTTPVPFGDLPKEGNASARVGVIEYLDFECPSCARFASRTLPEITEAYINTGKVQFAFRYLPLEQIHPSAMLAAEAAECGFRLGKFRLMHDELFHPPMELDNDALFGKARRIGLDATRFRACMDGEAKPRVRRDLANAQELQISGTPTFLFGSLDADGRLNVVRRESGALPTRAFAAILDALLDQ